MSFEQRTCHMTIYEMHGMLALLVFSGVLASPCLAAVPADEVKGLPGWEGALPTKQYSGYIEIDARKQNYLHYW